MSSESLAYSIVSCTSEDPKYPITSIQNASIRSNGWQSKQNPSFPVSFVIDLGSKCDVQSLQFVSHQSKIPCRVDLSYGDNGILFKPLGSFQFSDNSQTSYTARELKSANLSKVSTRFFKISIRGCHANAGNSFNQVGIVSLKVIGRGGTPALSSRPTTAENDLASQIDKLEREKAAAVQKEDFQLANDIKNELNALKAKKAKLDDLQKKKEDAIKREDFEEAKRLKDQIIEIANEPRPRTSEPIRDNYSPRIPDSTRSERPIKRQKIIQPEPEPEPEPIIPENDESFNDNVVAEDDNNNDNEDGPVPESKEYELPDELDEFAVPPSGKEIPNETRPIIAAQNEPQEKADKNPDEPDELSPANRQEAALLVSKFGEDCVARFFSRGWQLRLQGIQMIGEAIKGLPEKSRSDSFACFCKILRHRVNDNQKAIIQTAISLIQEIADDSQIQGSDLSRYVQPMLSTLASKIGGSNQQISESVCNFLVYLASNNCIDLVIPIVLGGKKQNASSKSLLARINCLNDIIMIIGLEGNLTLEVSMQLVVIGLEDAKPEVRQAATSVVVTLEEIVGSAVLRYIEKISKHTLAEVENAITENHKKSE